MKHFISLLVTLVCAGQTVGCTRSAPPADGHTRRAVAEAKAEHPRLAAKIYIDERSGGTSFVLESESITPNGYAFHFRDSSYDGPGNWCEVFTDESGKVTGFAGGL